MKVRPPSIDEAVAWLSIAKTGEYRMLQLAEWERAYGEAFKTDVVRAFNQRVNKAKKKVERQDVAGDDPVIAQA